MDLPVTTSSANSNEQSKFSSLGRTVLDEGGTPSFSLSARTSALIAVVQCAAAFSKMYGPCAFADSSNVGGIEKGCLMYFAHSDDNASSETTKNQLSTALEVSSGNPWSERQPNLTDLLCAAVGPSKAVAQSKLSIIAKSEWVSRIALALPRLLLEASQRCLAFHEQNEHSGDSHQERTSTCCEFSAAVMFCLNRFIYLFYCCYYQ